MEENERTHCENNAHMRNFAHVHCGNDRVRVCRPNFSEVAGQTRTKQKACLQFQPLATSTEEEKEEVGVEEESLVPQSQGEESKEEGDDQYIEDNVFAHKLTKRSYPSNNYDLKGSAVTQTLRSARDISGASDEEPHTCSTWGHGAFKTFTDEFYYFTSNCNYILSRHCKDDTEDFNVEIRRDLAGNLEHIFMKIDGALIVVANGTIKVKHKVVSLPYNDRLINIQEYGVDVRFTNKMHTTSLIWDYNNELSLTVDVQYHGKLCGLCGPFDESISTTYDLEFTLQSNLDTGGICKTEFPDEAACESNDMCSKIPNVFAMCSSSVNNNKFMKMCQMDACACKGAPQCHCSTFKKASKQCTHVNPSLWHTWRDSNQCPLPICPGNQVYQECGPACMPTCTDPNSQQQCDQCINTCGCQAGTVLDTLRGDNKCIKQMDCPCEYDGKIYSSGETRNSFCQSCICQGGKWECTKLDCPETCKIEEGTHITTFDGTYYNLIGDCSYHAIVTKDWSVKIEMHPCQEAHGQTCLQKVSYVKNQDVYTINYDGTVQLNGNKIELPVGNGLIAIFEQSSFYIQVHVRFELKMQIQISPIMQLCISLPRNALRSTKGLCGTFNDNAKDDFLSAQNIVEPAFITFSDSWKENEGCPSPKVNPICVSSENGNFAKEHCAYLKDPAGAFSICHSTVEFNKYYEMCKVASCSCQKVNDCVCGALGAYVHACAAKGIIVKNWRRSVCRVNCPPTQVYHHDVRSCNHTCRFLSTPDFTCELHDVPVDGCGCPEGTYMNEKKRCVNKSECPCYVDGLIRQKGELITVNGMNCYCNNGVPSCPNTINPPILQDCRKQNKIVSDCANTDVCKKTCATLNKPCPNPCVPGCVCPSGFVEDSSGKCILPSQCPCLFGGETFIPGAIISNDCNKCTCEGGAWQCTNNACPKTCQVYGDGHYITFDGKRYSFDGNCEYIFVEDQCLGDIGTFQILTESVPCCENGVTCSRNIRILFEDKEIILLSGSGVSEISLRKNQCTDNSYKIHTVGLYLVITFSNGITVIWDKRTRFSVTLDTRWKNKVCGLCGNFNNELEDELTTKENSLVASFLEFGNSWKSMQSCSDTVNQTFPCDKNPYCLAWAQRRCHIITGAIFQACHKMVDPTPYYDACVQEACACDMEGKYLSFCTAVAVYAEACNKADVCIRWRTPDLCPVYCDYYNTPGECSWHYQPCGTITTKTCSGHFIGKKYAAVLEGCYAKCPEKAPYLDENTMKCVTLPQCTCYYDGRILQPGETTMNDCEECMCKDGITTCQRLTTTTVPSTTLLTTTLLTSTSTISSTITSTEETTTMVTPSTSPSTTEETSTPTSTAETTTTSTTEETTTPTITTEKTNPQTTTAESTTSYTSEKTTKPTTEATTSTTPEVVTTTVSTSTTPYYTGKTTTEATSTESTSSSTTKQTTSPEKTTTESTTSYTSEKTTKPTTEAITSTTPEVTTTVSTSTTPYYMAKTTTEATSTESTSSSSTSSSTTKQTSPTVTPTSISSTTEPYCSGSWSPWFNNHTPSAVNPNDFEMLSSMGNKMCPSSNIITNIRCQFANKPDWPLSLSSDIVTCNTVIGLLCTIADNSVGHMCNDYKISVCCEPTEEPTTVPTTTSPEDCFCDSFPPRKCNETWEENCSTLTCVKDEMFKIEHIACEVPVKPKCYSGLKPVRVETQNGCCSTWDCDYDCQIWGGRYYRTFDGVFYNFLENCVHILVQEIVPKYNFSVLLDNSEYTSPKLKSCQQMLIIYYQSIVIKVTIQQQLSVTFNGIAVSLPYDVAGINISTKGVNVHINIPEIRATIIGNKHHIKIQVPEEYFIDNTQGQCGSVSRNVSDECKRRNGKIEPPTCCHKTGFDWKVDELNKPECRAGPTNVPCSPPISPPKCNRTTVCDILNGNLFSNCRNMKYFDSFIQSCQFDNCKTESSETDCSSLEAAAQQCSSVGTCVDWRKSAKGLCDYVCPDGFVYKACSSYNHNYCQNNMMIFGEKFDDPTEGCFCPEGMMLSEDETQCVPSCIGCRDSSGKFRNEGERWSHPNDTCIHFTCLQGVVVEIKTVCFSRPSCKETSKIWDKYHCCYDCPQELHPCKVKRKQIALTKDDCSAFVEVNSCEGSCNSFSIFDSQINYMRQHCECCKENETEEKEAILNCKNGLTQVYKYISAKTCMCDICYG